MTAIKNGVAMILNIEIVFLVVWVAFWIGFAILAIIWISEVAEIEKEKAKLGPSVLTVLTAFYSK